MDKHTANHVPNTKRKFCFTVSVLIYAICTYNNIRKQDTELSIADAHIMWIFLVPYVEIFFNPTILISAKYFLHWKKLRI